MSFVTHVHFTDANDMLACFKISDASPGAITIQVSKRKAELLKKDNDMSNDDNHKRGYTIDQKISMEALQFQ